ncbi:hypothetical protein V1224_12830 [Lachnospiraceae bacterium JLR.KK008]
MMTYKRWLRMTGSFILVGLGSIAGLVIIVDPFFHYHRPLERFPYQIDNQLNQNPGMAWHMEYDSVMLGSSMTVNFETDWFAEQMGLKMVKLSYNGAYPRDIHIIMKRVDESRQELKRVFIGVDLASYTGGTQETKYPHPAHLHDSNLFSDVNYWYNKDVLLDYILKPVAEGQPTDLSSVYCSEPQLQGCYSRAYVLEHYTIPEDNDAFFPEDLFIEGLDANLQANILPVIESHPQTQFTIFFPPYSILYWYEYVRNNQMDAVMYEYRYFMEKLLAYDNVELFFFPTLEEVVVDLDLYADASHYNQSINRYMTECFVSGEHRITRENYEEELRKMKSMIDAYDYDALFGESE